MNKEPTPDELRSFAQYLNPSMALAIERCADRIERQENEIERLRAEHVTEIKRAVRVALAMAGVTGEWLTVRRVLARLKEQER